MPEQNTNLLTGADMPLPAVSQETEDHLGMTDAQWERFQAYLRAHPFGEQDAYGNDLSVLRQNLKLTPTQRLEKHRRALELMMEVRRAGEAAGLRRRPDRSERA
jgi:hypothetical protein